MAEALSIIGLVSNVVQFVELGHTLVKKFREVHASAQGATSENTEIELHVQLIKTLVHSVRDGIETSLSQEGSLGAKSQLREFLATWDAVADRLLQFLEDRKVKSLDRYRPLHTLKELWRLEVGGSARDKISALRRGLDTLQSAILLCLTAIISDKQSAISRDLADVKAQNESMKANTLTGLHLIQARLDVLLSISRDLAKAQKEKQTNTNAELRLIEARLDAVPSHLPIPKETRDHACTPDSLKSLTANLLKMMQPEILALTEETESVRQQQQLLRSLWFETIRLRRSAIKDAHRNTFNWALSDAHDFTSWLKSGQGIYWVRGKAGSGKSTLMRFLSEEPLTRQHLKHWTTGQDLVIATHYFWYAGSSLQKSQIGLLRTLLFWIFKQCPELMKATCSTRLAAGRAHSDDTWTENDLLQAFDLLSQASAVSTKFCFFIDGLDEYTGGADKYHDSYSELVSILVKLSGSPNIKLCVSSRPWTPFVVAFGEGHTQLRLENLTQRDIAEYVRSRFASNVDFQSLQCQHGGQQVSEKFINDIVTRASGVFLWVSLVMSSLLNGLLHADDFGDLQRRLDDIPDDLDEFYRRMLEMIEPVYLRESIKIFQTSIDADQALPALAYEFLHLEDSNPEYWMQYSRDGLTEVTRRTFKEMSTRLNARCKDLLEFVENPDEASHSLMRYQVDFHHRTVRDFLKGTTVISEIMHQRKMAEFDSLLSLSKMMLALIKTVLYEHLYDCELGTGQPNINHFFSLTDGLMHYCRKIESQHTGQRKYHDSVLSDSRVAEMCRVLDELDHKGMDYMDTEGHHWTNARDEAKGLFQEYQQNSFLAATIQARLSFYLEKKLDEDATHLRKRGRPLLDYALRPTIVTPIELPNVDIGPVAPAIELLLQRGADPNQAIYIYDNQTPWALFLRTCYDHAQQVGLSGASSSTETTISTGSALTTTDVYSTMCLLLKHGADPNVAFQHNHDERTVGVARIMAIYKFSRGEMDEVERLMSTWQPHRSPPRMGWIPWAKSVLGGG